LPEKLKVAPAEPITIWPRLLSRTVPAPDPV